MTPTALLKRVLAAALSLNSLNTLQAAPDEYTIQPLFGNGESGVFHDLQSGQLLQEIQRGAQTFYMEQDGDLFEEDVATLDDSLQQLRSNSGSNKPNYSFSSAKRLLAKQIYPTHMLAFYSGCEIRIKDKKLVPVHNSCGFQYRKNKNRASRIEWEHIVPAWHFGHQLLCWQNGGRLNCRKSSEKFRQMEADMHNLVPAIGEINGDRSNYKYRMLPGEIRQYGEQVDMEVGFSERGAEPPPNVYGDIARAYFYMVDKYQLRISNQQRQLFTSWNNLDPVDIWEQKKNQLVAKIQGDDNPFISQYRQLQAEEIPSGEDFASLLQQIREQFAFLSRYLPDWALETLLVILAGLIFWFRRRSKKVNPKNTNTASDPNETNNPTPDTTSKPELIPKSTPAVDRNTVHYVAIISQHSGLHLSVNNQGHIVIETKSRTYRQNWELIPSNQSEGYVFIQNRGLGKVLAVNEALLEDDAPLTLEQKRRRHNNHQEWKIVGTEDEWVFMENRATHHVLDVTDRQQHSGAGVASHYRKSRSTENQLWRITS